MNCIFLTDEQLAALKNALYDMRDVPCLADLFDQVSEIFGDDEEEE